MAINPLSVFTGDIQKQAADQKVAGLQQGYGDLSALFGQGRDALSNNYMEAIKQWQNLQPGAMGGYNAYGDATGANGPEGLARAAAQYRALPGYASLAQEAATNAARAGVAGGQATGNTLQGITDRTNDVFQRGFGDYAQRLAPWLNEANAVAGGIGGTYTGLGQGLNQSFTGQGQAAFGTGKGIGEANAEGTMGQLTGLQNLWGLGMNAAKLAGDIYSGGGASALTKGLGAVANKVQMPGSGPYPFA